MIRTLIAGITACTVLAAPAPAAELEPGKNAPPLSDVNWLKGDAIPEFQEGHVYVLDFWATWCGPCVASIPHLNELQKQYKDKNVHVVGVAIWPNARMTPTKEFVDAKGGDMAYGVAEDIEGKTATSYMQAAGRNGIPTVFVVDKSSKVAWIGHPMDGLDHVLELVVTDSFNPEAIKKMEAESAAEQAKAEKLISRMQTAYTESDWKEVAKVADQMLALDQKKFSAAGVYKYMALLKVGDSDDDRRVARTYGAQLISSLYDEDHESLNALAWYIVRPETDLTENEVDAEFAVMVAEKAAKITENEDPNILDTLARAYFVNGEVQNAIDTQKKAIEFAEIEQMKMDLQTRLAEYQEAASGS